MARPSKLSEAQCNRIRMLREEGVAAPKLAKRFKISESSLYKILNGSYIAAPVGSEPATPEPEEMGNTPSIFSQPRPVAKEASLASRVRQAAEGAQPIDEVTLAAAELIVAQARYQRSLNR